MTLRRDPCIDQYVSIKTPPARPVSSQFSSVTHVFASVDIDTVARKLIGVTVGDANCCLSTSIINPTIISIILDNIPYHYKLIGVTVGDANCCLSTSIINPTIVSIIWNNIPYHYKLIGVTVARRELVSAYKPLSVLLS